MEPFNNKRRAREVSAFRSDRLSRAGFIRRVGCTLAVLGTYTSCRVGWEIIRPELYDRFEAAFREDKLQGSIETDTKYISSRYNVCTNTRPLVRADVALGIRGHEAGLADKREALSSIRGALGKYPPSFIDGHCGLSTIRVLGDLRNADSSGVGAIAGVSFNLENGSRIYLGVNEGLLGWLGGSSEPQILRREMHRQIYWIAQQQANQLPTDSSNKVKGRELFRGVQEDLSSRRLGKPVIPAVRTVGKKFASWLASSGRQEDFAKVLMTTPVTAMELSQDDPRMKFGMMTVMGNYNSWAREMGEKYFIDLARGRVDEEYFR